MYCRLEAGDTTLSRMIPAHLGSRLVSVRMSLEVDTLLYSAS